MSEGPCKKCKKNDDFANSIIDTFQAYFTCRSKHVSRASVFIRQYCITHDLCVEKQEKTVLKTMRETLASQMARYVPYIGKSPRYIPFFRPLYWKHYLIVRKLGFPIDVVWMILERAEITSLITRDSLLRAANICIKQSNYIDIHYLPVKRQIDVDKKHLYIWGEELAQKIYKETVF